MYATRCRQYHQQMTRLMNSVGEIGVFEISKIVQVKETYLLEYGTTDKQAGSRESGARKGRFVRNGLLMRRLGSRQIEFQPGESYSLPIGVVHERRDRPNVLVVI